MYLYKPHSNTAILSLSAARSPSVSKRDNSARKLRSLFDSQSESELLSVEPLRNESQRHLAWSKFRNGTGKLIIIHARKAGGSTMRSWMGQLRTSLKKHLNESGVAWDLEIE